MDTLQLIIIAVIVLVIIGIGIAFMLNQQAERTRRRMQVIQGRSVQVGAKTDEKGLQNKRRAEIAKKLKESKDEDFDDDKKKKTTIAMMIEQANLNITVLHFWLLSFVSLGLFLSLAKMMGQEAHMLIFAGVIGFFGFPRFVIKKIAAKRQKNFLEEFPDALEATVRLLKAGMPVSEAVAMISKEFEGPVGDEMSRIYDKQKIGVPLHEAAMESTRRMPLTEMQMFATGLSIQAQTGSSLSEVLMNLSNVIRARFRLKRKVKALSSEAIASASIIGALPVLVATGMYFVNYDYIEVLLIDPFGKTLLAGAIFWMCCGIFVMKAMINFKI